MTIRSKSRPTTKAAVATPTTKPRLTAEQRRAILAANAAKARAARTARSKTKQQRSSAPSTPSTPKPDAKEAKRKPGPAAAPAVAAADGVSAGSPDPFHLSPSWRIVAIDSRQWGLQTKAAAASAADADDSEGGADAEGSGGWRTVAYSGQLDVICRLWAGRYARSRPGKLPAVLAEVVARLQSVQAELAAAMAAL